MICDYGRFPKAVQSDAKWCRVMQSDAVIQERVKGRELAHSMASLLAEELEHLGPAGPAAFWEELAKLGLAPPAPHAPRSAPHGVEPFTDHQARMWGRTKMPFGRYAGRAVDEVPLEYLEKIAEPNQFNRSLRRYLASRRVQAEDERCQGEDLNHD